ncbi:MAG: S41 family peptidase [Alphaproteobacteria bacterium]|nr:S41 family peptidase [Alphaproteobacteria bacterium]
MFNFTKKSLFVSLVALLFASGLGVGIPALLHAEDAPKKAKEEESPDARDTYKYLSLFSDVMERVRADYVDNVTDEKLVESSLNGMLMSLDPHSGYMNKKNFSEMQTQTRGEFGGLGIEVTMEDNIVKVVSPIDDTPAAKAGLQSGDLITHIDDHPVTELTLSEAVDKMRGAPGSKIKLTVRRGGLSGTPFDVSIVRAVIKVKSVKFELKENIGYIRITTFNEQTQIGLDAALADFEKQAGDKVIGYVLDLRNNPGGLLEQAISVSSTFLPAGIPVVSTKGRHSEDNQAFLSRGGDKTTGKPIVLMVNGGSASASEIVAGALQDHRRCIVVGTKSFGKGSVQTIIPLQNGGAMRLTTARYYTPSGRSIQAEGIKPDIEILPAKVEEIKPKKGLTEADLKGALINDQKKKDDKAANDNKKDDGKKDANKEESKDKKASTDDIVQSEVDDADAGKDGKDGKEAKKPFDYQLSRALDLLRGISLYEKRNAPPAAPAEPAKAATP